MHIPELEERVTRILTSRLGLSPSEITPGARLVDDLGMDSLDAVELAIAVEREFGIGVSDEHVAKLATVADITALVQRLLEERGSAA